MGTLRLTIEVDDWPETEDDDILDTLQDHLRTVPIEWCTDDGMVHGFTVDRFPSVEVIP